MEEVNGFSLIAFLSVQYRWGLLATSSLFKFKLTHRPQHAPSLHKLTSCMCVCACVCVCPNYVSWPFPYPPITCLSIWENVCLCFCLWVCACVRVGHPHVAVMTTPWMGVASEKTASLCVPLCLTHADWLCWPGRWTTFDLPCWLFSEGKGYCSHASWLSRFRPNC